MIKPKTENYLVTRGEFECRVELTVNEENKCDFMFYNMNNGNWCEYLCQLKQNWKFQDPTVHEMWLGFLRDLQEFLVDFAVWTDGMIVNETILTGFGFTIRREA